MDDDTAQNCPESRGCKHMEGCTPSMGGQPGNATEPVGWVKGLILGNPWCRLGAVSSSRACGASLRGVFRP